MKKFIICLLIIIIASPMTLLADNIYPKSAKDLALIVPSYSIILMDNESVCSLGCNSNIVDDYAVAFVFGNSCLEFYKILDCKENISSNHILKTINSLNYEQLKGVVTYSESENKIMLSDKIYIPSQGAPLDYLESEHIKMLVIFGHAISQLREEGII